MTGNNIIFEKTVSGGGMWSQTISRGKTLRVTDLEGGANVSTLLYNADEPIERYNMPDTLKGQHTFQLTEGHCLHSDMGRLFCSIVKDTAGWHDSVCGCTDAKLVREKYGEHDYQTARNEFYRNGRENFLIELGKHGLGKKDIVPNLNLFSRVVSDDKGKLSYVEGASAPGSVIELRFEMDTLIVLTSCQHPLDPNPVYAPKPVKLEVLPAAPVAADDPCRISRPENERAFINTEDYYALRA
ncbi:MAG: urea carboxylase-associated family protein [Verrucomicrobiales bacterium]|nr:urea carboxylase-associated family protein [Verrucomicrobiales bacterium]